jgi:hypothetical protein
MNASSLMGKSANESLYQNEGAKTPVNCGGHHVHEPTRSVNENDFHFHLGGDVRNFTNKCFEIVGGVRRRVLI